MTETRTGLCLGGPKDGQMLAFDSEYFHCYETPISFRTILDKPADGPAQMTVTTTVYRWVRLMSSGFWALSDELERTPAHELIIGHLVKGYRRP